MQSHRGDLLDIGGSRKVDMTTAEGVQKWLDGFGAAPFDYEIRDLAVAADGDAAYAHGLARMGSAGAFSMWFRMTFACARPRAGGRSATSTSPCRSTWTRASRQPSTSSPEPR
jgi:hypothetical protein